MPTTSLRLPVRTPCGFAHLEFALVIAVIGVLVALALGRVGQLQALGGDAVRRTRNAQQQVAAVLVRSHCAAASAVPAAPAVEPSPRAAVPLTGTAPPASSPNSSCP